VDLGILEETTNAIKTVVVFNSLLSFVEINNTLTSSEIEQKIIEKTNEIKVKITYYEKEAPVQLIAESLQIL
jgi:hypothetical protein